MFVLTIGVAVGLIPSPLNTIMIQHATTMKEQENFSVIQQELLEVNKLQLYLARENCKNTAKTESALSRCDRQAISDAISARMPTFTTR